MLFVDFNENLTANAENYDVADNAMGGSVRFSIFSNYDYFLKG